MRKCKLLPQSNVFKLSADKTVLLSLFLLITLILLMLPEICLADCSSPPSGFGGAWARQYKQWCEGCCGTYSSRGPSCNPGSNWGCGQQGGSTSGGSTYDYEAERQRQLEIERQRQQEIEAERQRQEEENNRKKAEFEKNKSEALQSMKGISDKELGLKGSSSGDLGLKDISDDKLGIKDASSPKPDNSASKKVTTKTMTVKEKKQSASFQKGLRDASGCYEPNGKVYCLAVPAEERKKCSEVYEMGFNSGMEYQKFLLEGAFTYGKIDKEAGKKNLSFNHPEAKGPCRVKWIESYNRGYFAGKVLPNN
jgi:hypothetical protein